MRHLWRHTCHGKLLMQTLEEAVMPTGIHRSKADMWWAESCLRLSDFTCTKEGDYDHWQGHDLDRGRSNSKQKRYFDEEAVWLCARCGLMACQRSMPLPGWRILTPRGVADGSSTYVKHRWSTHDALAPLDSQVP